MRGFNGDKVGKKLQRIFDIGHVLEPLVIEDLKFAGYAISETDFTTGKQFRFSSHGGHFMGNADGVLFAEEEPVILEIKTMNHKKWMEFKSKGVKKSHPMYMDQLQAMMGLSGYGQALIVGINKNDALIHAELVEFDEIFFAGLKAKVEMVIGGSCTRRHEEPDNWICRGCFKKTACWEPESQPMAVTCQTCRHSVPDILAKDKAWHCGLHNKTATAKCDDYDMFRVTPKPVTPSVRVGGLLKGTGGVELPSTA